MPTCFKCGCECEPDELRTWPASSLRGLFLYGVEITKTCDPWAVHSAKNTLAADGKPQLTPLQQQIYDLIVQEKELTPAAALSACIFPKPNCGVSLPPSDTWSC